MAIGRCPHCNSPLGYSEAAGVSCPVCNSPLQATNTPQVVQAARPTASTGDYSTPVPVARAVGDGKPLASIVSRLLAKIVDGIVFSLFAGPGYVMLIVALVGITQKEEEFQRENRNLPPQLQRKQREVTPEEGAAIMTAGSVFFVGSSILALVQIILLSISGQSIGKKLLGIRIVNYKDDSNPGFFGAVLMREFLPALINCCVGVFSLIDILFIFGAERRCFHDMIAGTKVVLA